MQTAKPRMYFSEGLAIDYKWFDNHNITPRFEFGFGLTYSTFALSDLTLKAEHRPDTTSVVKTNEPHAGEYGLYDVLYVATVKVANTGAARAAAVPQLYMTYPCDDQPRHLRGYAKVPLDPGGAAAVEFPLVSCGRYLTPAQKGPRGVGRRRAAVAYPAGEVYLPRGGEFTEPPAGSECIYLMYVWLLRLGTTPARVIQLHR